MRRVRREVVALPAGVGGRLFWALALSATLHAGLLLGIGGRSGGPAGPKVSVLSARLEALPPVARVERSVTARAAEPAQASHAHVSEARAAVPTGPAIPAGEAPAPDPAPIELPADELPDSTHYAADELDVYPRLGARLAPAYPPSALGERIQGRVTVQVMIDERGRVTEASVVDAEPAGIFEESAREAFLHAAFLPAEREGRAVRSRILVHVEFDPDQP